MKTHIFSQKTFLSTILLLSSHFSAAEFPSKEYPSLHYSYIKDMPQEGFQSIALSEKEKITAYYGKNSILMGPNKFVCVKTEAGRYTWLNLFYEKHLSAQYFNGVKWVPIGLDKSQQKQIERMEEDAMNFVRHGTMKDSSDGEIKKLEIRIAKLSKHLYDRSQSASALKRVDPEFYDFATTRYFGSLSEPGSIPPPSTEEGRLGEVLGSFKEMKLSEIDAYSEKQAFVKKTKPAIDLWTVQNAEALVEKNLSVDSKSEPEALSTFAANDLDTLSSPNVELTVKSQAIASNQANHCPKLTFDIAGERSIDFYSAGDGLIAASKEGTDTIPVSPGARHHRRRHQ